MKEQLPRDAPSWETARMLRLIQDTALDGVVVMDQDGLVTDWSPAAEAILGWTRSEAVGRVLAELVIPKASRQAHLRGLERLRAKGDGPLLRRRIETMALHRSGSEFPIELSVMPFMTDGTMLFLGFVRDISERRSNEALLRRRAREAELLNHVTRLAAETGHLEEVLPACLAAVAELTGWPLGHVFLRAPGDPPHLVTSGIWCGDLEIYAPMRAATEAVRFGLGEGLPGRIWRNRKAYWVADVPGDKGRRTTEFTRMNLTLQLGFKATFGFPIIIGDSVEAVVEFYSHDPQRPDEHLLLMVRTIGDQLGRVLERRRVQDHQTLLLAELDHRAMNMLAVVMGLADQTARRAESLASFRADFSARLISMGRAYSLMTSKGWKATDLDEIIHQIVGPYLIDGAAELDRHGPPIALPPKAGVALSMILHELAANATKYGALSVPDGRLKMSAAVESGEAGRQIVLSWRESGLSGIKPPARRGFGATLIEASTRHELGGRVEVDFAPQGVSYRFEFPEPRL